MKILDYKETIECRACKSSSLESVLDLGFQYLSGHFPKTQDHQGLIGYPLELVKCLGECGLVQLRYSCDPVNFFGDNYGYRSGLNESMVKHLEVIYKISEKLFPLKGGETIVDIGSNDGTLLSFFPKNTKRIGFDPISKFKHFYPEDVTFVNDYFSKTFEPVDVITAICVLYDLEDPMSFLKEVFQSIKPGGIFICEQAILDTMLLRGNFDTICHEHLEYYSLKTLTWMLEKTGFEIVRTRYDDTNGGSAIFVCRVPMENLEIRAFKNLGFEISKTRTELVELVKKLRSEGKTVFGYGASTKGNTLLQYCGFGPEDIECIAEVNEEKFWCFTPGSKIPIMPESAAKAMNPDYWLILPWHFKDSIIKNNPDMKGKMIFPFPEVEIL